MSTRVRQEGGWAVVTAIMVMTAMLTLGLATLAYVDTEARQSGRERVGESAFNLSEGALSSQAFILARDWPATATRPYPDRCTQGTTGQDRCPRADALRSSYRSTDYAGAPTWTTSVRDNGSPPSLYYDAAVDGQPRYDANGDGNVWVRARAEVQGRRRTLVALVRVQEFQEVFPANTITSGWFATTNNGKKVIVDTDGSSGVASGPVAVRCTSAAPSSCLGYEPDKEQVSPPTVQLGYGGGNSLSEDALDRLEATAKSEGTYYGPDRPGSPACPANPSGQVVFVEFAVNGGTCSYNSSVPGPCCNSADAPGALIVRNGNLVLGGSDNSLVFYGVVYAVNQHGSTGAVVSLGGNSLVQGTVSVDGAGGISAGASGTNIVYDPRGRRALRSYPSAGIVQNTWREVRE